MVKVIKSSDVELAANFEEVFDGATVQEATAFNQKMPSSRKSKYHRYQTC